jgi:hypothetical protein
LKCSKCGYEDNMVKFKRASMSLGCCTGQHLRACPKCGATTACNPLMEELWEEQHKQKATDESNS